MDKGPDDKRTAREAAIAPTSQATARFAGLLYLGTIVAGVFAQMFARSPLVVREDAHATAINILAHQDLYRSGLIGDLVMLACYVGVTAIFYAMFRPTGRTLSLAAAGFSMTGIAVLAVDGFFHVAPLHLLGGAPYLQAFSTDQLQALALLSLGLHGDGYDISLVFFGVYCLLLGYLAFRSRLVPRIIGILMAVAGICYLVDSVADLAAPALAARLPSQILIPTLLGEGGLALWLLIFGLRPATDQRD
jgi:hypothetical protein